MLLEVLCAQTSKGAITHDPELRRVSGMAPPRPNWSEDC